MISKIDSKAEIDKCLSCALPECTNCLYEQHKARGTRVGRGPRRAATREADFVDRYPNYVALRQYLQLLDDDAKNLEKTTRNALRSLSAKQREYVTMYYVRKIPMRNIAKDCGVNLSTVSRTIARAEVHLTTKMHRDYKRLLRALDE